MFTVYYVLIGIVAFFIAALVLGAWLRGHRADCRTHGSIVERNAIGGRSAQAGTTRTITRVAKASWPGRIVGHDFAGGYSRDDGNRVIGIGGCNNTKGK